MKHSITIILLGMPLSIMGCGGGNDAPVEETAAPRPIHFTDITTETGIDFTTISGETPSREILEVNGSGLALIDYDQDSDLDLFILNGATMENPQTGPGCRLYTNEGNMHFRDGTKDAGIDIHSWAMGVAVGDFDGDGEEDLYITCYGPNILLRNRGDGTFEDVSAQAGVDDDRWGTGAAWGDIDSDGDLDLYVANYLEFDPRNPPRRAKHKGVSVMNGPHGLPAQHDILYENQGDGTFMDITEASGCLPEKAAFGLNVVILDFDNDGRQDILAGNDSMGNFYYHQIGTNAGAAPFEEIGLVSGAASSGDGGDQATMGMAIADVDSNGFPDLFTTNFSNDTNTLHLNSGRGFFDDRTRAWGLGLISRPFLGWACGFYDFDLDGDEDLIVCNGHVYPEATKNSMDSTYEQPPLLFERKKNRFHRVSAAGAWLQKAHRSRGAVFGDLDKDGDIDIVVTELNGPVRVLRNDAIRSKETAPPQNWLIVKLQDDRAGAKNRNGLGAKIELISEQSTQTRWIYSGGSFQSASAQSAHFGLGDQPGPCTLRITWPDGTVQNINRVDPGSRLIVNYEEFRNNGSP